MRRGRAVPAWCFVVASVLLALGCAGLGEQLGIVICLCMALVLLANIGGGTWWQLERARHPPGCSGRRRACVAAGAGSVRAGDAVLSLFDQKASTWVLQGREMTMPAWFTASQMQALNPLLRRGGWEPIALRRMICGIAFSGLAWIAVGAIQVSIDGGEPMHIAWQILPYALLTFSEVLVSATGTSSPTARRRPL